MHSPQKTQSCMRAKECWGVHHKICRHARRWKDLQDALWQPLWCSNKTMTTIMMHRSV